METKKFTLPDLGYAYGALAPHISESQLTLHHDKHHRAYVNAANVLLDKIASVRSAGADLDMKALSKDISFQIGGHALHSLMWKNLKPAQAVANEPKGMIADLISAGFGSFERFKKEFALTANSTEGSGWAALCWSEELGQLVLAQIEKHTMQLLPNQPIFMVLDVFEHEYYVDYKNERAKYVEACWNIINWDEVNTRLSGVANK